MNTATQEIMSSSTFKAAVLVKQRKPLKILNLKMPEKLDFGQVLVKIIFTGICGSQIGEIEGVKGKDKYLPHLLGHEGTGVVAKVGPGVKSIKVGNYVSLHWKKNKTINAKPFTYFSGSKKINSGNVTSFSKFSVISENRLTKIPKAVARNKISALFGCCLLTGFGVIKNDLKIKSKDRVAIFGVGGLGLANLIYLKKIGVKKIICFDIDQNKLTKSLSLGCSEIVNVKNKEKNEIIKFLLKNNINKIIENTGNISNIESAYDGLSSNGVLCLVGVPKHNEKIKIHTLPIHFGKRIIGCHGGTNNPGKDINTYIKMFKKNNFKDLEVLVGKVGKLKNINLAISQIKNSSVNGRYLIKI